MNRTTLATAILFGLFFIQAVVAQTNTTTNGTDVETDTSSGGGVDDSVTTVEMTTTGAAAVNPGIVTIASFLLVAIARNVL